MLGAVIEPVKGYARTGTNKYTADTPLNRLPDSIPPESLEARKFSLMVDRIVAGTRSADDLASVRASMSAWKLNHDRLSPALQNSLLADDASVSQNLSTAGAVGLQALEMMASHSTAPAGWAEQQTSQLEQMKKPQAELLLMIVPAIQKLVQAVPK